MRGNTIIEATCRSKIFNANANGTMCAPVPTTQEATTTRSFQIQAAHSSWLLRSAKMLVDRMYSWRGYQTYSVPTDSSLNSITFLANEQDTAIATLSLRFDGPQGLLVDDTFPEEVNSLRRKGMRICESTKLAIDGELNSLQVFAALFHVGHLYSHCIRGCDCALIEVNPRHVLYYQKMLGFKVLSTGQMNQRVNAPAVLLCLDFTYAHTQFHRYGGKSELFAGRRSIYPLAFSPAQGTEIITRLQRSDIATESQLLSTTSFSHVANPVFNLA